MRQRCHNIGSRFKISQEITDKFQRLPNAGTYPPTLFVSLEGPDHRLIMFNRDNNIKCRYLGPAYLQPNVLTIAEQNDFRNSQVRYNGIYMLPLICRYELDRGRTVVNRLCVVVIGVWWGGDSVQPRGTAQQQLIVSIADIRL